MKASNFNIGDTVLCYSCERCRIEQRPRDREMFTGIITRIDGSLVTVKNKRGYNMYYDVCCLERISN